MSEKEAVDTSDRSSSDLSDIFAEAKGEMPEAYQDEIKLNEEAAKQDYSWMEKLGDDAADPEPAEESAEVDEDLELTDAAESAESEEDREDDGDEQPSDDDESSEEDEELEATSESDEEVESAVFIHNDNEFSIPLDAVVEVKVDGEIQEVPMKEVLNGISGQRALAQRFTALDAEKKDFQTRIDEWNEGEALVRQNFESGNVVEALDVMFTKAGYNSEEVMMKFFDQIAEPLETYMNLPPEQKQAWAAQVQAERNRLKYEQVAQERDTLQAKEEQLKQVRQVQRQYGLDDAAFAELYYKLQSDMEQGIIGKREITAGLVGKYHEVLTREGWVIDTLNSVDPALAKDQDVVADVFSAVAHLGAREQLTEEKVKDLIHEAYGQPAKVQKAKAVSKVLRKKGSPKATKKAGKSRTVKNKSHRGAGPEKPKHFLEQIIDDYDSAKTAEERRKVKQK